MIAPMRILITGFEPFGGDALNPSEKLVLALAETAMPGLDITTTILPCAFAAMPPALEAAIARHRPNILLGFGLAGGRSSISVERIGINVIDARIADNEGAQPVDAPVIAGGPAAYFVTIPIKAIYKHLNEAGIPAEISQTAGTFVCNAALYTSLHLAKERQMRSGFVHLPYLPEMVGAAPSLSFQKMILAGRIILKTLRDVREDFHISAGAVS
jgi:pyroglutamyl-peptidase